MPHKPVSVQHIPEPSDARRTYLGSSPSVRREPTADDEIAGYIGICHMRKLMGADINPKRPVCAADRFEFVHKRYASRLDPHTRSRLGYPLASHEAAGNVDTTAAALRGFGPRHVFASMSELKAFDWQHVPGEPKQ